MKWKPETNRLPIFARQAERQEMDKKYAIIRNAEEGQIPFTINLSSSEWNKLKAHAEKEGFTYQEIIKQLINKI